MKIHQNIIKLGISWSRFVGNSKLAEINHDIKRASLPLKLEVKGKHIVNTNLLS